MSDGVSNAVPRIWQLLESTGTWRSVLWLEDKGLNDSSLNAESGRVIGTTALAFDTEIYMDYPPATMVTEFSRNEAADSFRTESDCITEELNRLKTDEEQLKRNILWNDAAIKAMLISLLDLKGK